MPHQEMTKNPIVVLKRLAGAAYAPVIEETLEQIGFFKTVAPGGRVFLKPNLTFPEFRPGVMTSLDCLRAVTVCLISRGYKVIIGEADSGGYNRFSLMRYSKAWVSTSWPRRQAQRS